MNHAPARAAPRRSAAGAAHRPTAETFTAYPTASPARSQRPRPTDAPWFDPALVAAARRGHPDDAAAFDALVTRYGTVLFSRCECLTGNRDRARDLAQDTWARVLGARRPLDAGGNVLGYLMVVAANLWRDQHRAARRAGTLAERRLASLDVAAAGGDPIVLADAIPDGAAALRGERALLRLDVDRALARLAQRSREMLTARFLDDESAAEIGRRYGRTEQTITAWVRQAVREIKPYLQESAGDRATSQSDAPAAPAR